MQGRFEILGENLIDTFFWVISLKTKQKQEIIKMTQKMTNIKVAQSYLVEPIYLNVDFVN